MYCFPWDSLEGICCAHFFKLMLHACKRQNNTKRKYYHKRGGEGGWLPSTKQYFHQSCKDCYLAFLQFPWQVLPLWHKIHPKGLHRASPAFCFSQQHKPALHCIKEAPTQRLHMMLLTLLFMIIFLFFGT